MEKTKAKVFIIESAKLREEKLGRSEGKMLLQMLNLVECEARYEYIRTQAELKVMLKEFADSEYRYLHLSCHGNNENFGLTLDLVPFSTFARLVPRMNGTRRLFLSACSVTNQALVKALGSKFISIIGPHVPINWDTAAVFWASFYHLMLNRDGEKMENADIKSTLQRTTELFDAEISAFFRSTNPGRHTCMVYPTVREGVTG